jgi:hypothetical protein
LCNKEKEPIKLKEKEEQSYKTKTKKQQILFFLKMRNRILKIHKDTS